MVILMEMRVSQVGCFQITGRWIFLISNLKCFLRDFCQKVYEETIHFQLKFQKSISKCSILQKIKIVILKWQPFEYKVKSLKICPFWGLGFFSEVKKFWHFEFYEANISVMIFHLS